MSKTDFNEGRRYLKIRDREDYFRSELLKLINNHILQVLCGEKNLLQKLKGHGCSKRW
jgi:hypothetical protein